MAGAADSTEGLAHLAHHLCRQRYHSPSPSSIANFWTLTQSVLRASFLMRRPLMNAGQGRA